jgi:DNA polymerase III beta subunit
MELAQKISKLKSVVPKKSTTPVLQGILVRDGYLIANNMELTVKAKIEGADGETFIIPAKALDLISNLPDGEIEITAGSDNTIVIKAEKIKNKYQTMDPSTFPLSDDQNVGGDEITIKSNVLLESMKRVSYAIPAQNSNHVMTAMCLEAAEGTLNFVGLDGHVLAWDKVDYDGTFTLLIPKATVEKILSLGISGDVSIRHSVTSAVFVTDDYEIYTRLINGEYFKYQKMFNELPLHTVVTRNELLDAMIRAKMCTDDQSPARFELSGSLLNISIKDLTTDYQETITLQEAMQSDVVIGFNSRLVIETLKAFDCENVGIQLAGGKQPMIVEAEDSDFRAIVLPVAMR